MVLVATSFVAGFLTVLAPCILPLLPVILAGSLTGTARLYRTMSVIAGLAVSVVVFTLLLKATTTFLGVPQLVWQTISGLLLIGFGLVMVFPALWEKITAPLSQKAGLSLQGAASNKQYGGDFLLGAALGPVLNSCSPTYALIVAVILPTSFSTGLSYLLFYTLGLSVALFLIALFGRVLVSKLGWVANPDGWFHKVVGVLLVVVGIAVIFGLDKSVQTYVLDQGWYDPIIRLEERLN